MRKQINEIYIFRAIVMLAVVMIHVTSDFLTKINPKSTYFVFYNGLNIFASFAVPTFIFISALVMFYSYFDKPLTRTELLSFYKKRLLFVVLPYIIISTFYYALKIALGLKIALLAGMKLYLVQLLTGGAYFHLYFMFIIIQFYLLFPLILFIAKRKIVTPWLFLIGVILQFGYIYLNRHYIVNWHSIPNVFHKRASLFPTYIGYYMLGATIGIYLPRIAHWFEASKQSILSLKSIVVFLFYSMWLASGFYYVYIYFMNRTNQDTPPNRVFDLMMFIFSILSSLVILHLSHWIMAKWGRRMVNLLIHLGVASLGIYFFHPAVLLFYRKDIAHLHLSHPVYYGLAFLLALSIPWLFTTILMKFPKWSWLLAGPCLKRYPIKQINEGKRLRRPTLLTGNKDCCPLVVRTVRLPRNISLKVWNIYFLIF